MNTLPHSSTSIVAGKFTGINQDHWIRTVALDRNVKKFEFISFQYTIMMYTTYRREFVYLVYSG